MWSGTNVWVGHEMSGWSICFYLSISQYLISMGFPMVYKSTLLNEQPFWGMTRSRWEESKFFGLMIDSYDMQCESIYLSSLTKKVEKNGGMCGHCALPFASRCTFLDFHSFLKNFCSVLEAICFTINITFYYCFISFPLFTISISYKIPH